MHTAQAARSQVRRKEHTMSTSDIIKKLEEIRALSRLIEEAEAELDGLKDEIKEYMGDSESMTAGDWKVSYKTVTSSRVDTAGLKKALPDIAAQFTKVYATRRLVIA